MQIQPETIIWNQPPPRASTAISARSKVFQMRKSDGDRMAGSMPVWSKASTAEEKITAGLASATQDTNASKFATALAEESPAKPKDDSFGFLDFVDMINPLQHIPIVSTIYQKLTGDTIKPVSQVVGGAAFGGPLGAAAGLVNALMQTETGKDVGGNVLASLQGEKSFETVKPATPDTTIALANLTAPQPHYNS